MKMTDEKVVYHSRVRVMKWARRTLCLLLVGVAFVTAAAGVFIGCARNWLPKAILYGPNTDKVIEANDDTNVKELAQLGVDRQLRVAGLDKDIILSLWIIQPVISDSDTHAHAKKTVFILHGLNDNKASMLGFGRALSREGFQAVLVDLRCHGQSSGQWVTYGVKESCDLQTVIDSLQKQNIIGREIGVFGPSFGGAVALQLAAIDSRVMSVVVVATYTSMRDVVPIYVRKYMPLGFLVKDSVIDEAITKAGEIANFDPGDADSLKAIQNVKVPVLIIHGRDDKHIPIRHGEKLFAASDRNRCKFLQIDEASHVGVMSGKNGQQVFDESIKWFDRWLD